MRPDGYPKNETARLFHPEQVSVNLHTCSVNKMAFLEQGKSFQAEVGLLETPIAPRSTTFTPMELHNIAQQHSSSIYGSAKLLFYSKIARGVRPADPEDAANVCRTQPA